MKRALFFTLPFTGLAYFLTLQGSAAAGVGITPFPNEFSSGALATGNNAALTQDETASVNVQANDSSGFSYQAEASAQFSDPTLQASVRSGDDLLAGTEVLIGTFSGLSDAQIEAHAMDTAFLESAFTLYGTAQIGQGTGGIAGTLNAPITASTSPSLAGQQIYYFVIAATDNSSLTQTFDTAFQLGIYYFDKSINSAWTFPADADIPNSTTVDIADLTAGNMGTALQAGAHVVVGSFGPDQSNRFPTATDFVLASVPEPSSGLLLGMAGAGLLAARGRRRT